MIAGMYTSPCSVPPLVGSPNGPTKTEPDFDKNITPYRLHPPNTKDGGFDKIIIYTRNVIIRTHGDYFSQTKAVSGLNTSIGCVEILYGLRDVPIGALEWW